MDRLMEKIFLSSTIKASYREAFSSWCQRAFPKGFWCITRLNTCSARHHVNHFMTTTCQENARTLNNKKKSGERVLELHSYTFTARWRQSTTRLFRRLCALKRQWTSGVAISLHFTLHLSKLFLRQIICRQKEMSLIYSMYYLPGWLLVFFSPFI